jgi:peptidoglycan/xylan/chitin deacetylase (PgdA/CDA1 family)
LRTNSPKFGTGDIINDLSNSRKHLKMIGVIAGGSEAAVVVEFFELFKTPWEWYRIGTRYQVLLCVGDGEFPEDEAELVLRYAGYRLAIDGEAIESCSSTGQGRILRYKEYRVPIHGACVSFRHGTSLLVDEESERPIVYLQRSQAGTVARIGYDLFDEVRRLLTAGQPAVHAAIPTLDLHITLLREFILAYGMPLVEIPPVPYGHQFIACLTHDVDHPLIRRHRLDTTIFGFLYRAVFGSVVRVLRGQLSVRGLLTNWLAALKLPFVHLGLAHDFWFKFYRYIEIDEGSRSTFFVIPFRNHAGSTDRGPAPDARAACYGAEDVSDKLHRLMSAGCEIGLHGIDAWHDACQGRAEREEICRITGQREIGVRMHWLYYDEQSPVTLERAGVFYDSTVGYNETIGYRAGTTQVYKPLQTSRLLELPLHIMDTALFFSRYLNLSEEEARERVSSMIENAVHLGGCITVNWHDRSIAPERQWDHFYRELINQLRTQGAWFSTAAQTVSWFRMRRSATFENITWAPDKVHTRIAFNAYADVPRLQLRVYQAAGIRHEVAIDHETANTSGCRLFRSYTVQAPLAPHS